jgi:hypothetical protein
VSVDAPGSVGRAGRIDARLAVVLDVIVVLAFVGIGRSTHDHGISLSGMSSTSWPFLSGLAIGWLVVLNRGWSGVSRIGGVAVWLSTVAIGMGLRVVSGQGIAFAFVLVALAFVGAAMLGWRAGARGISWWTSKGRTPRDNG